MKVLSSLIQLVFLTLYVQSAPIDTDSTSLTGRDVKAADADNIVFPNIWTRDVKAADADKIVVPNIWTRDVKAADADKIVFYNVWTRDVKAVDLTD